jgi:hypothetical protein
MMAALMSGMQSGPGARTAARVVLSGAAPRGPGPVPGTVSGSCGWLGRAATAASRDQAR